MLTYRRGGNGLLISGVFLAVVGVGLAGFALHTNRTGATEMLTAGSCILFGVAMLLFFARVQIDPHERVVKLASGLRFSPRYTVHPWDEFDTVVENGPTGLSASDGCYSLYLRHKDTQELIVLVQQYTHREEMAVAAKELSELMNLPVIQQNC